MAFFEFTGGMLLAILLGVALFVGTLGVAFDGTLDGAKWVAATGLFQWIYLTPLARLFHKKGSKSLTAGLLVGGGFMTLLISTHWGLFLIY